MKRKTYAMCLCLFLLVSISATAFLCHGAEETCPDYDCLGKSGCLNGLQDFNGCAKDNPCVGGGSMKCEKNV